MSLRDRCSVVDDHTGVMQQSLDNIHGVLWRVEMLIKLLDATVDMVVVVAQIFVNVVFELTAFVSVSQSGGIIPRQELLRLLEKRPEINIRHVTPPFPR